MDPEELAARRAVGEMVSGARDTLDAHGRTLMAWLDPVNREALVEDIQLIHRLVTETGRPISGPGAQSFGPGAQIFGGRTGLTLVQAYQRVFTAFRAGEVPETEADAVLAARVDILIEGLGMVEARLQDELQAGEEEEGA